jgi:hypothetical protein
VPFAYSASTEGCTFLLDEDGVCLRVILESQRRSGRDTTLGGRTRSQAARRCIGAQYVASIDVRVEGALVPMPRVGAPMLFAYTGDDGRIAVVRTGNLVRFETMTRRDEVPVTWANDDEDGARTIPLHQSGERLTPRVSLFDANAADTLRDPWTPPPRPTWASIPSNVGVRLQKVNVVGPSETAPTLERMIAPAARGMLPRKNARR